MDNIYLEQIRKARTITWKTTFYSHVGSKDRERIWMETETRSCAYRAPGLYRQECLDTHRQTRWVAITDVLQRKELNLNPEKKEATLFELATVLYDLHGPFAWIQISGLKHNWRGPVVWFNDQTEKGKLAWAGKKETANGEADVFRAAFKDMPNNRDWSYDFWIEKKSKQLTAVHIPGANIYDPEKDPARENLPEESWSWKMPMGSALCDIHFDVELDESLFRMVPPADYTFQSVPGRAPVTEKEMVEYLGVLAAYNDNTFSDQVFPFVFTSDELTRIEDKPIEARTPAEQNLLNTIEHYKRAGLNKMPTGHFVEEQTVEKSFRYLGQGVKLGDQDRMVCWYKLPASDTYRVVYANLTIKDIFASELPL